VFSVDLVQKPQPAEDPARQIQLRGDALRTPLRSASVQLVFCASLIEHVAAPDKLLAEIERILAPGGEAYISFPPYYSPMGGHEFAPYHYLGERAALRLTRRRHVLAEWARDLNGAKEEATSFADLYAGWGLFRMTVGKMRRLVAASGFDCLDMSTRYLPYSFIRWPVIGEALTWHAQFLLRKR
jgi:SAM-dependent methyltransferase